MDTAFTFTEYVLKRKGLSLGGKYELYSADGKELLFTIEEKTVFIPPSVTIHVYRGAEKTNELLTLKDSDANLFDIFDGPNGAKLGSISEASDAIKDFLKDSWILADAGGKEVARFGEKSLAQSILRGLFATDVGQNIVITTADTLLGVFHQKNKLVGYELQLNFSLDANHLLDRRLGIAAAVFAAYHQSTETDLS
jgi:hypothetical protein